MKKKGVFKKEASSISSKISSLVFLGGGNMAEAIISCLLSRELLAQKQIIVSDVNNQRLAYLSNAYGIKTFDSNIEALELSVDPVIIAVKPQHIVKLLNEISAKIGDRLIISIAAGIKISLLQKYLPNARIIRVMPNTAALVGEAITAISQSDSSNQGDIEITKKIFNSVGEIIEVKEDLLNAVTALSGSGPAYFFYLTEALIKAGKQIGLSEDQSTQLSIQTAVGAGQLLESSKNPQELRNMVTSPAGTTEAAIKSLEQNGFFGIVEQAVQKAYLRAQELSNESNNL